VFVGGLHRSGTTPLTKVLGSHPEISRLSGTGVSEDEGQHLQNVYPRIRQHGGMGRFALSPAAHLTGESALATPHNAERLIAAWSPFWEDRPLLLEKSPANMIMGQFLQALFPGCHLIVVIRHPVAVSLAMQKWNPRLVARNGRRRVSMYGLVRHWLVAHRLLRADAPAIEHLHVVRYEDLVADPETSLGEIQRFLKLDEPFDARSLTRGRNEGYQKTWDAMRSRMIGRHVVKRIESEFRSEVAEYGYAIDRLSEVSSDFDVGRFVGP